MALSSELISQFVKVTNDDTKSEKESTLYGTIVQYKGSNFVKLDGSELLTPISSIVDVKPNERVMVTIRNHSAMVTGNVSSPSARTGTVEEISGQVSNQNDAIMQINSSISQQQSDISQINTTIQEQNTSISTINSDLEIYNSSFKISSGVVTGIKGVNTEWISTEDLESDHAAINNLNSNYANISFSNIGKAAMEYFYANSGLIQNVVVDNGTITGQIVGVTISGDRIEGNTVIADKLVIKGDDGLYYKLNTDGITTETEQTDYNSLNGSVIKAKSITATKISVTDLVAFDATIGGFNITENSIYSGVKESIDNATNGIYLDKNGQMYIGDSTNYLKYYMDENSNYKLEISADILNLTTKAKESINIQQELETIQNGIDEAQNSADTANLGVETNAQATTDLANTVNDRLNEVELTIDSINDSISMLVQDENGFSLMEQKETGWVFSMGETITKLQQAMDDLTALETELDSKGGDITALQNVVSGLEELNSYVKITTENSEPCIELGNNGSFKVRITNTGIQFIDGTTIPAYVTNESLKIGKAEVEDELTFGGFAFAERSNGNMGLFWKGG